MESEFKKIIGHDNLKKMLRQFYKKACLYPNFYSFHHHALQVRLDEIRQSAGGKKPEKPGLYHMTFAGWICVIPHNRITLRFGTRPPGYRKDDSRNLDRKNVVQAGRRPN